MLTLASTSISANFKISFNCSFEMDEPEQRSTGGWGSRWGPGGDRRAGEGEGEVRTDDR